MLTLFVEKVCDDGLSAPAVVSEASGDSNTKITVEDDEVGSGASFGGWSLVRRSGEPDALIPSLLFPLSSFLFPSFSVFDVLLLPASFRAHPVMVMGPTRNNRMTLSTAQRSDHGGTARGAQTGGAVDKKPNSSKDSFSIAPDRIYKPKSDNPLAIQAVSPLQSARRSRFSLNAKYDRLVRNVEGLRTNRGYSAAWLKPAASEEDETKETKVDWQSQLANILGLEKVYPNPLDSAGQYEGARARMQEQYIATQRKRRDPPDLPEYLTDLIVGKHRQEGSEASHQGVRVARTDPNDSVFSDYTPFDPPSFMDDPFMNQPLGAPFATSTPRSQQQARMRPPQGSASIYDFEPQQSQYPLAQCDPRCQEATQYHPRVGRPHPHGAAEPNRIDHSSPSHSRTATSAGFPQGYLPNTARYTDHHPQPSYFSPPYAIPYGCPQNFTEGHLQGYYPFPLAPPPNPTIAIVNEHGQLLGFQPSNSYAPPYPGPIQSAARPAKTTGNRRPRPSSPAHLSNLSDGSTKRPTHVPEPLAAAHQQIIEGSRQRPGQPVINQKHLAVVKALEKAAEREAVGSEQESEQGFETDELNLQDGCIWEDGAEELETAENDLDQRIEGDNFRSNRLSLRGGKNGVDHPAQNTSSNTADRGQFRRTLSGLQQRSIHLTGQEPSQGSQHNKVLRTGLSGVGQTTEELLADLPQDAFEDSATESGYDEEHEDDERDPDYRPAPVMKLTDNAWHYANLLPPVAVKVAPRQSTLKMNHKARQDIKPLKKALKDGSKPTPKKSVSFEVIESQSSPDVEHVRYNNPYEEDVSRIESFSDGGDDEESVDAVLGTGGGQVRETYREPGASQEGRWMEETEGFFDSKRGGEMGFAIWRDHY